ncbi:MAG: PAS domain S-box protein [Methanomicrobiales archaeon]|nr:PAS domain S-box protein [Methanomicrobiales archaeon]
MKKSVKGTTKEPTNPETISGTPEGDEQFRQTGAYNRSLIEASLDPLVTINPDGTISDVNEATVRVTGYSRKELIGTDFSGYFTKPKKAKAGYEKVFRDGSVRDYPLEIRHKDGHITPVLYNATVFLNENGEIAGVFAAARDITERKKAEEERTTLAAIVESSDDAIIGKSLDGTILSWNAGAEKIYGYSAAEVIGKSVSLLVPRDQVDDLAFILGKIKQGEPVFHYETVRVRKDGKILQVSLTLSPIKDQDGHLIGVSTIARDITGRKKAEEAIQRASVYNRSLIEASLDPLVTISSDGTISDVNEATVQITGYSREALIGTDFSNYFTEPGRAKAGYVKAFKEGSVTDYELQIRHRDGRITPVLYNATVYRDESGHIAGVFAAARDTTERKKAEEIIRRAGAYNRSLIEASLDPLVTISQDGKISDVNDATVKITGFSREELIGTDFSRYFVDPQKAEAGYETVFREGSVHDYELQIRHRNGRVTPVLYNATVFRDESGHIAGVFAAARDVTERKQAEDAVRQAGAYNRSLIEASLDPLVTISPEGKINDVNEATVRVTGVPREELIGTDFSRYFTEPEKAKSGYEKVFREGSVTDYELEIRHRNGQITPVLYNATVYRDESGEIAGVFAAARDTTERKKAEEIIRRISTYNRSLIEVSLDPLVTINADGTINDVNEATVRVTGVPREELIGTDFSRYFTEPEKAKTGYEKVFRDGSVIDYGLEIRHRYGQITPVLYNATVYRDEFGHIAGVFAAARDVTERKRAEHALLAAYNEMEDRVKERTKELVEANRSLEMTAEELKRKSEELARSNLELQQFAYIASHDLQEPLRGISGFTELLEKRYKGRLDEKADLYINFILDGTKQMHQVIQDLLEYSRVQTKAVEFGLIDTNLSYEQALVNLHGSITRKEAIISKDHLPEILADGTQITQLFQNLIGNALKFQKPNVIPEIHVSARKDGDYWLFSVRDNGIGIESRFSDRIFKIFQRLHAKGEFEGTGIGLAICKRIVERHGGEIYVKSTPGEGSTFFFTIPNKGDMKS